MRLPFITGKKLALIFACSLVLLVSALAAFLFVRPRGEKALASGAGASGSAARMKSFPRLFLWAWERPERLEFIDPREVGVAFLAGTLYLRGEIVIERPRMQPLKVPQGTTLIAVVRIESVREAPPSLTDSQRAGVVKALLAASRAPNVRALQIDFDASTTERHFYRSLLHDVRAALPAGMPLSMTALASWCAGDNWLDDLPVDEAVPMLFSMGLDEHRIKSYLKEGGEFRSPVCRLSRGISTDEPLKLTGTVARTYVFHTKAWTADSVRRVFERSME